MNIFVTGAESTGKSTLTKQLAEYYGVVFIEEYARTYIAGLGREYNLDDLAVIAKKQIEQIAYYRDESLVFFDTGLIITYIWYQQKFNFIPDWLSKAIPDFACGKYLLCSTDIPWEKDPLRENPHRRDELNELYRSNIIKWGFDLEVIAGQGEMRLKKSIEIIDRWMGFKGNK